MNIAIDIRCLMDKNYSGIGEHTYRLLSELFIKDQKNQYFLFYNSAKKGIKNRLPKFSYHNVFYCGFSYPNKILNLSLLLFGFPKIDEIINKKFAHLLKNEKIDLFFLPNINFISLSRNCKLIITVHDLSFKKFPEFYNLKARIWHKLANFKKIIKKSSKIIAVSKNTKTDIQKLYNIPDKKIQVIYSGINQASNIKHQVSNILKIRKKYNLPKKFILYLGNLEARKNIESLIKAYSKIKQDIGLIIVGGKLWKYKNIYKTVKQLNLRDRVIFTGYIHKKEKKILYNLADIFVYPSYYEGFGIPPLEAMAAGTPVIASYSSSLPEIIGNSAIIIDPFNAKELEQAIIQILNNNELRDDLKNKGIENAKKFSWQKTAEKTCEFINRAFCVKV
ncbi:MAG: glycosyltransferase family 1 protein [Patescibacteria group bacterium]|nr:glycosyltransferase family 1 protein [Patescibacteria group bacterium]